MKDITLDQIKCFIALAEEGSFSQAAVKLHRAKSAVNYGINKLEDQLGFRLFDRQPYRPTLTPAGEKVLQHAYQLSDAAVAFASACSQIEQGVEHKLVISISDIFPVDHVLTKIRALMEAFPQTEIVLEREILSGEQMLREGSVDIAIFENLQNKQEFDWKQISTIKLPLVIAKSHKFFELPKKKQNLGSLSGYPQIVQRSTLPNKQDKPGVLNVQKIWRVTDTLSKKELIQVGLGWGRLPSELICSELAEGTLVALDHIADPYDLSVYVCRKKNREAGKVTMAFWEMF